MSDSFVQVTDSFDPENTITKKKKNKKSSEKFEKRSVKTLSNKSSHKKKDSLDSLRLCMDNIVRDDLQITIPKTKKGKRNANQKSCMENFVRDDLQITVPQRKAGKRLSNNFIPEDFPRSSRNVNKSGRPRDVDGTSDFDEYQHQVFNNEYWKNSESQTKKRKSDSKRTVFIDQRGKNNKRKSQGKQTNHSKPEKFVKTKNKSGSKKRLSINVERGFRRTIN